MLIRRRALVLCIGVMLLIGLWAVWGFGLIFFGNLVDGQAVVFPESAESIANFAAGFGILASLVTSATVVIAAIQLVQSNDESQRAISSLEESSKSQYLLSRSSQVEMLFDGYFNRYLTELQSGLILWSSPCNSLHNIRDIVSARYHLREQNADFKMFVQANSVPVEQRDKQQADFVRAANALGHELEIMGVKCMTSAVPAGVLLAEMGGHWALQWLLCSHTIRETWQTSENTKSVAVDGGSPIAVSFSRRHGFWLAAMSALYCLKEWPDGHYGDWARAFVEAEFHGDAILAHRTVQAIYKLDADFFDRNPTIESLMEAVAPLAGRQERSE